MDEFHSKNIQAAKTKLAVLQMNAAERKAYEQYQISRANAMELLADQYQEGIEQGIEHDVALDMLTSVCHCHVHVLLSLARILFLR